MGKNKNKKHFLKLYEKNDDRYIYYYVRFHDNGEVAFIIEDHDDTFVEFFDGRSVEYRIVKLTSIRDRVHLLLGTQRNLVMPQVSDLFGKKGMEALRKLRLDQPHRQLMLQQDLDLMKEINVRIQEDEKAIAGEFSDCEGYRTLLSIPGIGPILGAVVLSEIDGIGRFPSSKKLLGYAGLAPTTSSSGGKTYHGRMIRSCNKWLKWALVEAAWVAVGCDPYFGGIYHAARARGKLANTSITLVASRMATIIFHLLKEQREYKSFPPSVKKPPAALLEDWLKGGADQSARPSSLGSD